MIRFRARRWNQEDLAKRLCQVIEGSPDVWRDDTGRWHLGVANDWWLHPKEDECYLLHYRYERRERMQQLAAVLGWLLNVEILETD